MKELWRLGFAASRVGEGRGGEGVPEIDACGFWVGSVCGALLLGERREWGRGVEGPWTWPWTRNEIFFFWCVSFVILFLFIFLIFLYLLLICMGGAKG